MYNLFDMTLPYALFSLLPRVTTHYDVILLFQFREQPLYSAGESPFRVIFRIIITNCHSEYRLYTISPIQRVASNSSFLFLLSDLSHTRNN